MEPPPGLGITAQEQHMFGVGLQPEHSRTLETQIHDASHAAASTAPAADWPSGLLECRVLHLFASGGQSKQSRSCSFFPLQLLHIFDRFGLPRLDTTCFPLLLDPCFPLRFRPLFLRFRRRFHIFHRVVKIHDHMHLVFCQVQFLQQLRGRGWLPTAMPPSPMNTSGMRLFHPQASP